MIMLLGGFVFSGAREGFAPQEQGRHGCRQIGRQGIQKGQGPVKIFLVPVDFAQKLIGGQGFGVMTAKKA